MRKWLGRICEGIVTGAVAFVVASILNKLIFQLDDWLFLSLCTSIPWIFAKLIVYYFLIDKKCKRWPLVVSTATCILIGSLFVLGVCLSVNECWLITFRLTYFSTIAMVFVTVDKPRDEKRSAKRT